MLHLHLARRWPAIADVLQAALRGARGNPANLVLHGAAPWNARQAAPDPWRSAIEAADAGWIALVGSPAAGGEATDLIAPASRLVAAPQARRIARFAAAGESGADFSFHACGAFACRCDVLLAEIGRYAPDALQPGREAANAALRRADFRVLIERSERAALVEVARRPSGTLAAAPAPDESLALACGG